LANFLVQRAGQDRTLYAFDFARSLYWGWPLSGFLNSTDVTCGAWVELRERHGFDLQAAILTVDRLAIIPHKMIESMLSQMPAHWLTAAARNDLLAYCREGHWTARAAALRKGFEDGSIA
jgi:hypothetical protein